MISVPSRWWAPGRLELIGEHTDYNDGYVLPLALPLGITCTVTPRPDGMVRLRSGSVPDAEAMIAVGTPAWGALDSVPAWARYPLGVIREFERRGHSVPGLDLEFDATVPIGAGLSSSAALTCSTAIALRDLSAPGLSDTTIIEIARIAENRYAGVPTGILDQSAAMLCTAGHLLFLDTRTRAAEQIPFDLPRHGLTLLVFDTGAPRRLADGEYARRRAECAAAAAQLGVPALRDIASAGDLARLADPLLRRRARHVVTENQRVLHVAEQLRAGVDPRGIGPVLTAAHASLREDFEVSTDRLDTVVEAAVAAGAYGARMTGGGFGGSALALVDLDHAEATAEAVREAFARRGFPDPVVLTAVPSRGAHRL